MASAMQKPAFLIARFDRPNGDGDVFRFIHRNERLKIDGTYYDLYAADDPHLMNSLRSFGGGVDWKPFPKTTSDMNRVLMNLYARQCYRDDLRTLGHWLDVCVLYVMDLLPGVRYREQHHKLVFDPELRRARIGKRKVLFDPLQTWSETMELFCELMRE